MLSLWGVGFFASACASVLIALCSDEGGPPGGAQAIAQTRVMVHVA
jgi:hypothetical protein